MTRKQKLFLNMGMGLLKQLIITVCGFVLPRYMLLYYGSAVNGLVSSITHFLGFISLLEMGIGPVIQANLYKPLADKDHDEISKIVVSSERFFRRIAYIFIAYIAVLAVLFPAIEPDHDAFFSISLLIIIAISTFAQYYFGATYQLLLNADQKSYVQMILHVVTVILNTVFSVVLIRLGMSIHLVKLVTAAFFVMRPLGQAWYVHKRYKLNKKIKFEGEPIKQKWNGFSQHLASVICGNIAVVVLTLFSTLENVSVYSVYYLVVSGVTLVIMTAATGLESYFGNMIAKNEAATLNRAFEIVEFIVHAGVSVLFTVTAITIVPFIRVYTDGVGDANYIAPLFAVLLTVAYAAQCLRIPYFRIIKAAGHFKQTQNGAYISTALNAVISLALVFRFGLCGIAIGTLAAMLFHTCYFVWYLRKNILERSSKKFILNLLADALIGVSAYFLTRGIAMTELSYLAWVVLALKVTGITLAVTVVIECIFNYKQVAQLVKSKILKKA